MNSRLIGMYILIGEERDYPKNQQEVNPLWCHDMALTMVLWYSSHPDSRDFNAGVAQLDRASVYETEGYRFESCHPRLCNGGLYVSNPEFHGHDNTDIFHDRTSVVHPITCHPC